MASLAWLAVVVVELPVLAASLWPPRVLALELAASPSKRKAAEEELGDDELHERVRQLYIWSVGLVRGGWALKYLSLKRGSRCTQG